MIAGENEALYAQALGKPSAYDNLFGIGKGKRVKSTKQTTSKEKGKFWKSLGNFYKDAGGVEGIGSTVANLASAFKGRPHGGSSDYQLSVGADYGGEGSTDKEKMPVGLLVIGGVVVVGVILYVVKSNKESNQAQQVIK